VVVTTTSQPAVRVTGRRAERHQRTKREILDAASALAAACGLAGWSLRDVAGAVGMRALSLYVYFDSKNALYDALYADGYTTLLARTAALPRDGSPVDVLRRGAHLVFDFCVEAPARYTLMFLRTLPGFEPSPPSYALAERSPDELAEVLAAAGASTSASLDLYTALLTGLATQQASNHPGGDRWARLVDPAVDMYVATQLPRRSATRPRASTR
jgi:AcrR family transcriptional regulator